MDIVTDYPVRKVVIEFKEDGIYANGHKQNNIDTLLQWLKDTHKQSNYKYNNRVPKAE